MEVWGNILRPPYKHLTTAAALTKYFEVRTFGNKKKGLANSVDPDVTNRNEPSHQNLHCLPSLFCHYTVWHFDVDFCLRDILF